MFIKTKNICLAGAAYWNDKERARSSEKGVLSRLHAIYILLSKYTAGFLDEPSLPLFQQVFHIFRSSCYNDNLKSSNETLLIISTYVHHKNFPIFSTSHTVRTTHWLLTDMYYALQMEMLEKRHQSELKVIRNQSRQDIDSLRKQIEIVKDAGMKVQKDLGAQLEGAIEREKETNEALRAMKLRYDQRDANFLAGFKAMMEEVREERIAATRSYEELLRQMSLTAETETSTISVLKDTVQLLEEHRKEAVTMRSDIQTLREQLEKAQNPGLISWVIRKIF